MPLFVVATPIGNAQDISQRAQDILRRADLVIGEELKVLRQTMKAAGVQAKALDQLNEHSRPADLEHFVEQCRDKTVALVSDCGTPGFCDPGADLVQACATRGIAVHSVPGASSLMALLSVCGIRLDQFSFLGFLPAKSEVRSVAWAKLQKEAVPFVILETPYRCAKWIEEIQTHFANRYVVVGLNLTQDGERVVRAMGKDLKKHGPFDDAEPIALIMPVGFKPTT